ncbi:MAG: phage tail sheath subtilisin-like domain-containing protein, partial [Chloroflexota bacterium]
MATTYATPGVYVEVQEKGTKPIEAAGTSMAAFIGISAKATGINELGEEVSLINQATLVTNWTQYTNLFGGFVKDAFMPDSVYGYFNNGGGPCYIVSLQAVEEEAEAEATKSKPAASKAAADADAKADKKPAKAEPKGKGGPRKLTAKDFIGDASDRTGLGALEALDDVKLVLIPDLMAGYDGSKEAKETVHAVQTAMITHCELMRYRFAILDTPPGLNAQQVRDWRFEVNYDTRYAAMYYPWISVANLSGEGPNQKMVPPSGHIVGIYNRTDAERGVYKAPANEIVQGALDLELNLSKGEQSTLNPDGINCIRVFPGRGIRVWGARTLSSDGSWRYINVQRLFSFIGDSLDTGLQWVVFEPNDHNLWAK